eukprot:m.224605 g.224605  ORF g.224605 m.224605 type:complete len:1299 (+) comp18771_c0_seq2:71-3967(+)
MAEEGALPDARAGVVWPRGAKADGGNGDGDGGFARRSSRDLHLYPGMADGGMTWALQGADARRAMTVPQLFARSVTAHPQGTVFVYTKPVNETKKQSTPVVTATPPPMGQRTGSDASKHSGNNTASSATPPAPHTTTSGDKGTNPATPALPTTDGGGSGGDTSPGPSPTPRTTATASGTHNATGVPTAVTFEELAVAVVLFIRFLQQHGIGVGDRVGTCGELGLDWLVAQLALWMCGAVFVPLDSHLPTARLESMVTTANVSTVLLLEDDSDGAGVDDAFDVGGGSSGGCGGGASGGDDAYGSGRGGSCGSCRNRTHADKGMCAGRSCNRRDGDQEAAVNSKGRNSVQAFDTATVLNTRAWRVAWNRTRHRSGSGRGIDAVDGIAGIRALASDSQVDAESPSHIFFTSGSTGTPKAVLGCHGNLCVYALGHASRHGITEGSRLLVASSVVFDPSIGDSLAALISGATLCLVPHATLLASFADYLAATNATHVCSTPPVWSLVDPSQHRNRFPALSTVMLGGAPMPPHMVRDWAATVRLFNVFGCTECCVYQFSARVYLEDNALNLGQPLAGVEWRVVDQSGQTCQIGSTGELWLGGLQLCKGYLGAAVDDSRWVLDADELQRFYKTGDWVHLDEGGQPVFCGRRDTQVKLSGVRVELGDIEAVVARCKLVREVAVVKPERRNAVVAFVADRQPPGNQSRAPQLLEGIVHLHCRRHLPTHMVPARVVVLADLPRTPTDKVDRVQLCASCRESDPADGAAGRGDSATGALGAGTSQALEPRTKIELAVAAVWSHVLNIPHVNLSDDFVSLGGDSLAALKVALLLRKRLLEPCSSALAGAGAGQQEDLAVGELSGLLSPRCVLRRQSLKDFADDVARQPWWPQQETQTRLQQAASEKDAQRGVQEEAGSHAPQGGVQDEARSHAPQGGVQQPAVSQGGVQEHAGNDASRSGVQNPAVSHESHAGNDASQGHAREPDVTHVPLMRVASSIEGDGSDGGVADAEAGLPSDDDGLTEAQRLLRLAARHGDAECLTVLLEECGVDPDGGVGRKHKSVSPLALAAGNSHLDAVNVLLSHGASITACDARHVLPVHRACGASGPDGVLLLQRLLDAGSSGNARDANKHSLLHWCCRAGTEAACSVVLQRFPGLLEARDRWHRRPIHWAVLNGHVGVVRLLLQAGATINTGPVSTHAHRKRTTLRQEAPLHIAVRSVQRSNGLDMVRLLVDHGADVNAQDQDGATPLHTVVRLGQTVSGKDVLLLEDVAGLLLTAGARVDLPDFAGQTPLTRSAETGQQELHRLFVDR